MAVDGLGRVLQSDLRDCRATRRLPRVGAVDSEREVRIALLSAGRHVHPGLIGRDRPRLAGGTDRDIDLTRVQRRAEDE